MINQKELDSLTWKYFRQQKWEEIKAPLILITFVFAFIGIFISLGIITTWCEGDLNNKWWLIMPAIYGVMLIVSIFVALYNWLKENYDRAKDRATRELGAKK